MPPVRTRLHTLARASQSRVLQSTLFFADEIKAAAEPFLAHPTATRQYPDIPIRHVRGIARTDERPKGTVTWAAMAGTLECNGWRTHQVFGYFNNAIRDTYFPGTHSRLELVRYGTLAYVSNGCHRIIAGMLYLASRRGDDAVLQQVCTDAFPLDPQKLRVVQTWLGEQPGDLYVWHGGQRPSYLPAEPVFLLESPQAVKIAHLTTKECCELFPADSRSRWTKLRDVWMDEAQKNSLPHKRREVLLGLPRVDPATPTVEPPSPHQSWRWTKLNRTVLQHWFDHDT